MTVDLVMHENEPTPDDLEHLSEEFYSFKEEKREALDRWARHVAALVDGTNVVRFPVRGGGGE